MLALHPPLSKDGRIICYRPSMEKFHSPHTGLEVCNVARATPCYLNRNVILLMTHNGAPGDVFMTLQNNMMQELDAMVANRHAAALLLPKLGRVQSWCVSSLLEMLQGGWEPQQEVFLGACLEAVRRHHLMELKSKSRILVPEGKQLMGVMDEFAVLQPGEVFVQVGRRCLLKFLLLRFYCRYVRLMTALTPSSRAATSYVQARPLPSIMALVRNKGPSCIIEHADSMWIAGSFWGLQQLLFCRMTASLTVLHDCLFNSSTAHMTASSTVLHDGLSNSSA